MFATHNLLLGAAGGALALGLAAAPVGAQTNPSTVATAPDHAATQAKALSGAAAPDQAAGAATDKGLGDIVVTAAKKADAQNVQQVPFAVTAFGTQQMAEQHVRTLTNLSYSAPNVQLENVGTAPGYANFSIRGLGISSSIPSIDPTVGVFVDGVYMGISGGILFDTFDLAGVEVLRGPQGLLFGRNVTGGAVVVRTSTPGNKFEATGRVAVESGLNKIVSGVVSGPIVKDKLAAKIAVYYDKDDGYFVNHFTNNQHFGKSDTLIVRGALNFTPTDDLSIVARYEHGRERGDGPVVSNYGVSRRGQFYVDIGEEGYSNGDWDQAILETNLHVGLGNGVVTNVFGYRRYDGAVAYDVDATRAYTFHANTFTGQHQYSNELRYAGTFGRLDLTTGLYYFQQNVNYVELRRLAGGALRISGGGRQDQHTYGAFLSTDFHITDTITLNGGVRYSYEKKQVDVANLIGDLCDPIVAKSCSAYGFHDSKVWQDPTFKLGAQWQPSKQTQLYGFFARGFRSGGYNFRNGNATVAPGPFDSEQQNSFEVGLKQEIGRTLRLNLAAFHNDVDGLQREIITPVLPIGTTQVIRNSANVRIQGVEAEALVRISPHLSLTGQLGYTDGKYTKIFFDLTGDGVIDAKDYALLPPRLAPWTYGGSATFRHGIGGAEFSARFNYSHRDAASSNDANTGIFSKADMIDLNVSIATRGDRLRLSIYGNNMLNQETQGNVSPLPFFAGSTFASINKGRVIGGEIIVKY